MSKAEAKAILHEHLAPYRLRAYEDLGDVLDEVAATETVGPSGTRYRVEVRVRWDDRPGWNLRVVGCIADDGWRARVFGPLCESFIVVAPDNFPADE